jgi:hypothetical protein
VVWEVVGRRGSRRCEVRVSKREAGRMTVMWRVGMVRLTIELVTSNLRGPLITPFANGGASYSRMEYSFGNTWPAIL